MDATWFKDQQKKAGVTADRIAAIVGRDRSGLSKIYSGQHRMTLPWARAIAQALNLPLDEVLAHAGELEDSDTILPARGFSDGDAAPFDHGRMGARSRSLAEALGAGRAGVDIWQVKTSAMLYRGFAPGDYMLVDGHASERCKAGDTVIAQVYNAGSATTVLREYRPPVLVARGPGEEGAAVHVVDGSNVLIRGRVTASWRATE